MVEAQVPVHPGRGVGFLTLGASLHDILTRLKAQPQTYPKLNLTYSPAYPIASPIVLNLPENGIRLRFDGPDQRLRLIEILDFSKMRLAYQKVDFVKPQDGDSFGGPRTGLTFKSLYERLLGPTFEGEYIKPGNEKNAEYGTYVLSYPGIAFSFPVLASAWSPNVEFLSFLQSSATKPATTMAIFSGHSWPEARSTLYISIPPNPRSLALCVKKDSGPDEVDVAKIHGEGRVELVRRSSPSFWIVLSETTPQDLITELGPPDAIYRKSDRRLSIHRTRRESSNSARPNGISPPRHDDSTDTDRSSSYTETEDEYDSSDSLNEEPITEENYRDRTSVDCFYNYFHHGFDFMISHPKPLSPPSPRASGKASTSDENKSSEPYAPNHLTATKLLLHGNVPGSYPFNRHRRSRWTLEHVPTKKNKEQLSSEMPFNDISKKLKEVFKGTYESEEEEVRQQRPMALNRGWGDSPGSSCELLGGWEETLGGKKKDGEGVALTSSPESGLGNTQLYGFPGMVFEVLKNDAVSCLTVF